MRGFCRTSGLVIVALAAIACGIVEPEVNDRVRGKADWSSGFAKDQKVETLCRVDDPDALRAAIEAHVADGKSWSTTPMLQKMLDEQTNSEAVPGNSVELLENGVESYPRRWDNIAKADVVLLKTYNFRENNTGRDMVAALTEVLDRNPQAMVFVQFDRKGFKKMSKAAGQSVGLKDPLPELFKALQQHEDGGGFVMPVNTPVLDGRGFKGLIKSFNPAYGKDHEKYLITWAEGEPVHVVMGGLNVGDEWAYGGDSEKTWSEKDGEHAEHGFRDTDLEIIGPATEQVVDEFLHDAELHWQSLSGLGDKIGHAGRQWVEQMEPGMERLRAFVEQLRRQRATAYKDAGKATIRFVANRPFRYAEDELTGQLTYDNSYGAEGQYIERLLCLLMRAAPEGTAVRLSNAFVFPPPSFEAAMKEAVAGGVKFELLLNNEEAPAPFGMLAKGARCSLGVLWGNDTRIGDYQTLGQLAQDNVALYRWPGGDEDLLDDEPEIEQALTERGVSTIHQKVWSFGADPSDPVVIGSSNLDYHSLRHNSEGVVMIYDEAFKQQVDRMLDKDFALPGVTRVKAKDLALRGDPSFLEKSMQERKCKLLDLIDYFL